MSVHRCPDCVAFGAMGKPCKTCNSQRYVHRNSHGRITHPATAEEFSTGIKPRARMVRGKPSKF